MKDRIQSVLRNPDIYNQYMSVYKYRGVDICTLKEATPSSGDRLGYVIDHNSFRKRHYDTVQSAIEDIEKLPYFLIKE